MAWTKVTPVQDRLAESNCVCLRTSVGYLCRCLWELPIVAKVNFGPNCTLATIPRNVDKTRNSFLLSTKKKGENKDSNADDATVAAKRLCSCRWYRRSTEDLHGTIARVLYTYIVATLKTGFDTHEDHTVDIYEDDDFYPRTFNVYLWRRRRGHSWRFDQKCGDPAKIRSNGSEKDKVMPEDHAIWESCLRLEFNWHCMLQ